MTVATQQARPAEMRVIREGTFSAESTKHTQAATSRMVLITGWG